MQNVKNDHSSCQPIHLVSVTLHLVRHGNLLFEPMFFGSTTWLHTMITFAFPLISSIYYNDAPIHDAYVCFFLLLQWSPIQSLTSTKKKEDWPPKHTRTKVWSYYCNKYSIHVFLYYISIMLMKACFIV